MTRDYDKERQFKLTPEEFLEKLDFLNWYRYFYIIKELTRINPQSVLEVGPGEGTIKRVMAPFVPNYETIDVNKKLTPTHIGDVREKKENLKEKYDGVIAADILEHIPFEELEDALKNLNLYLKPGGRALITIPHRAWFIFEMDWLNYKERILRAPDWLRNFYHRVLGRKENPIDLDHQWEIGDGKHSVKDVEDVMKKSGFTMEKRQILLYVDFWVLRKK